MELKFYYLLLSPQSAIIITSPTDQNDEIAW